MHAAFRPWAWACVWIFIIWGSGFYATKTLIQRPMETFFDEIEAFPEKSDAFIVIAFGDSLLRTSLPEAQEFRATLGNRVHWLHRHLAGADLLDFRYEIEMALDRGVDLILIQDALLLNTGRDQSPIQRFLRIAKRFVGYALTSPQKLTEDRQLLHELKHHSDAVYNPMVASPKIQEAREYRRKVYRDSTPLRPEIKAEIQSILVRHATKLVIFHLPAAAEFDPSSPHTPWLEELAREMIKIEVDTVSIGEPLKHNLYSDGRHINKWGQSARQEQFTSLIDKVCCDRSH